MYIGYRLKELRKEKRLTQGEVANVVNTTQKTISDYERGISNPDLESIKKLAAYFNVSTDYLLGNTDDKNKTIVEPEQLSQIDIALYNATSGLTDKEKDQILDFVNYIKNKKPNS